MRYLPVAFAIPLLSACSFGNISLLKYDNVPVVHAAFQLGATKQSILTAGGRPDSVVKTSRIEGQCWNYTLRDEGDNSPFFVAFNRRGQVVTYGYSSCQDAEQRGLITSDEPMKPRF